MRVYLDHAATAPLTEPARAAMIEAYAVLGNPAAAHGSGRQARAVLDDAREVVATCVGADPERVVFTSGGTEADNLAVFGGWQAYGKPGRLLLTSTIEHQAVLDSAKAVANQGGEVRFLPVNAEGEVTGFDGLDRAALISVMRVNNETGALNDIGGLRETTDAVLHSDWVQAFGKLPLNFADSGLDMVSISSHKIGGPVGIGALVLRKGIKPAPITYGGGQEAEIRSGTQSIALAAGFAAAAEAARDRMTEFGSRMASCEDVLMGGLNQIDGWSRNGSGCSHIVNVSFEGCLSGDLLFCLDQAGFDVSAGSACHAGVSRPSPVLVAMGRSEDEAVSALRFSFGAETQVADVEALVQVLPELVARARRANASS